MKIRLIITWDNDTSKTRGQCGLFSDSWMMKVAQDTLQLNI